MIEKCSFCGEPITSQNKPLFPSVFTKDLCYDCEMFFYEDSGGNEEAILTWHWNLMINC